MKVKECMSLNVCYCNPESTVKEAAKLMCDNHVGCIPVCDNSKNVVGVLTDRDVILRTIACDKDATTTPVSEIMTCKVCCCTPETDINEATKLMSDKQIRRIPVVQNNQIVGILTLGDLANSDTQVGAREVCNTLENICNCSSNAKNAE